MITFKYKNNDVEVEYKTENVVCGDVIEDFKLFLYSVGFHPETVRAFLPGEDE